MGTFRATSSAWEGPDRVTTGKRSPVASRMIWLIRRNVPFSIPFDTETKTVPGESRPAICSAVDRTPKEGVAITTTSLPTTQSKSQV